MTEQQPGLPEGVTWGDYGEWRRPEHEPEPEEALTNGLATPPKLALAGGRNLADIDRSPPAALLVGRVSPNGHTILFGPGNAGKGVLASWWLVQHVQDGGRVLILDFEDHPEEWARRIHGLGGADVAAGVAHVSPLALGGVNWALLHEVAAEHGATLVVIDSVAYAVPGADPSDPTTATTYSAAIQPFGLPVLSLAHTNRVGDTRYPFGSVFWHAGARVTWSLMPHREGENRLKNQKANNYDWQGEYAVTSDWLDDVPRGVYETRYSASVSERVAEALAAGPASLDDIVAALAVEDPVKRNTVVQALRRGLTQSPRPWSVSGDRWRLVDPVTLDLDG